MKSKTERYSKRVLIFVTVLGFFVGLSSSLVIEGIVENCKTSQVRR